MTEATVLAPFMKKMRELLPLAQVVKHRDASMIGLPDFSITHNTHVLWCEAKLFVLPRKWNGDAPGLASELTKKAQEDSPTQTEMMKKMHRASASLYVIFVKKTFVALVDPETLSAWTFNNSSLAAQFLADRMNHWTPVPFPNY